MKKRICDICKTNEATRSFKVKESHRTAIVPGEISPLWTCYTKIDICDDCGKKLLNSQSIVKPLRPSKPPKR